MERPAARPALCIVARTLAPRQANTRLCLPFPTIRPSSIALSSRTKSSRCAALRGEPLSRVSAS